MKGSPPLSPLRWWWQTSLVDIVILFWLLVGHVTAVTLVAEKCYCVKEHVSSVKAIIANFTALPEISRFEYIGAAYNGTVYPCVCTDVVRVVTELAVTEEYVLQQAASGDTAELNDNVTRALDDLAEDAFQNNDALMHTYHNVLAEYKETNDSKALFTVEFVLKGSNWNVKDWVAQLMLNAIASGTLNGVGTVDNFTMAFSLRTCPQDPGPGPANTQVTATNKVAGSTVTYTCKSGFRTNPGKATKAESKCVHEDLTWSSPTPAINCVEDKRCLRRPPSLINTIQVWNGKIEEGTVIIYSCKILYKTVKNDSVTYRCLNKIWTRVSHAINCQFPSCGDPPQVPDHGVLTYTARDEITYRCDTYAIRSGVDNEHKITCENGTWDELPNAFICYGSDTYDAYQEWENFLHITLPVSVVLVFVVILCLLCTRIDSPVCQICNGGSKEVI